MAHKLMGWHAENVKAELRKKFGSLRAFAEQHQVSQQSVSEAISTPIGSSRVERMIAEALGVEPHALWPERWSSDNKKIDRVELRRQFIAARAAA